MAEVAMRGRIPVWFKITFTGFVAVLVPYYWVTYTPWNFLYFCDVALLMTLAGVWTERPILISMPAVGILLPQALWIVDFLARAVAGVHVTGMTGYMFDDTIPLFVRGLSSFHGWLPVALLWLVWRVGYDRRALARQAMLAVGLLGICYLIGPEPPASARGQTWAGNINYVYGFVDGKPQTALASPIWLLLLMSVNVFAFLLPTHAVLHRSAPAAARAR
jgi:hypothetical protein